MRSTSVFVVGLVSFVTGLGFYHYFLFLGQFTLPINYTFRHNPRVASFISLEELLRGPLSQNDSRILSHIVQHLRPPSTKEYNLTNVEVDDPSMGQSTLVRHALNNMRNGFFVECGALDGELRSNTLHLEKYYGWTGLLIEGDPENFKLLVQKNRKAWASDFCLATKKYPHQVLFEQDFNKGRISVKEVMEGEEAPPGFAHVQCFPFFSFISALNVTTVDYLSLDVEGSELDILRTIPFHSVYIKVLSVEYIHDKGGREGVKRFMTSKGYRVFGEVTDGRNWANDLIFLHSRLTPH